MMKLLTTLSLLLLSISLNGQDECYYWYKGDKVPLVLDTSKKFLLYESSSADNILSLLKGNDYQVVNNDTDNTVITLNPFKDNRGGVNCWAVIEKASKGSINTPISLLSPKLIYEAPFFKTQNGEEAGLSHLFYVRLHNAEDIRLLEFFATERRIQILGNNRFMPLWFTLACTNESDGNALEMANLFYESGKFSAAEPDLMVDELLSCVDDTEFSHQWNLNNTGQNGGTTGIDIQFCEAFDLTAGNNDIVIAVVDQGIELDHPDLPNMFNLSFNTETGTQPSQVLGSHGIACAGIVGAAADNDEGVAGIASGCQLMSVSNSLGSNPNSRQRRGDGINWAWINGADIISNSWGSSIQYEIIDDAIDSALIRGRNGLGCIVVFASGNDNSTLNYPANSNPDIIAVGAMSPCAERKSPNSCDDENWGSNYDADLDIVAPGVFIPTTDRQGSEGYNSSTGTAGDYFLEFNGTSSATPHVAGVAALVLSVNPNLTQDQVRNIIESTAQKVGNYTYSTTTGRPNGTWNSQMGYGLVSAYGAIIAAAGGPITGPNVVCSSGSTFSISPPVAFDSLKWDSGLTLSISSGQGTTSCTFTASGSGNSFVNVTVYANGDSIILPNKVVWAGTPYVNPSSIQFECVDGIGYLCSNAFGNEFSFTYDAPYNSFNVKLTNLSETTTYDQFTIYDTWGTLDCSPPEGTHMFHVRGTNTCGTAANWTKKAVLFQDCGEGGLFEMMVYPNPATDDTKISLVTTDSQKSIEVVDEAWKVEVYTQNNVLKLVDANIREGIYTLNTSNWPVGIYYIKAYYKNEILTKSLIINK